MGVTRRALLGSAGGLFTATALANPGSTSSHESGSQLAELGAEQFPELQRGYLNSAAVHPLNRRAASALRAYVDAKEAQASMSVDSVQVRAKFATLIGAEADEIAYVPSTTGGENLVVMSLGLSEAGGRVVTDALHFVGSFYIYEQLQKQGVEVVVVPMEADGTIDLARYEEAITPDTRLVATSHVSFVNGFEHDVRALCEVAHAQGALVYADIIQSAGSVPVDVKDWGVDFAASGTYKWLMGDFGLAFLYVRGDLVDELERPRYGYLQTRNFFAPNTRLYPLDPPGEPPFEFVQHEGTAGHFNGSFPARMAEVAVNESLDLLLEKGIGNIQAERQPLVDTLQEALRGRGYQGLTPVESRSPIVSFVYEDAGRLRDHLNEAGLTITLSGNRIRISPSVFNNREEIQDLIEALGEA